VSGLATRTWSRVNTNVLVSGHLATRTWSQESLQMSWWMALLQEPEVESHYECPDEWPCYKNLTSKVITNVLVSLATRTRSRDSFRMSWWVAYLLEYEVESLRMSWWVALLQEPDVKSHYKCPGEWPCYKNLKSRVITNVLMNGHPTRTWRRKSLQMFW
jgi:ribosomal protein L39E